MSEKPHTVAIGAFVVGALLIAITTVLFMVGSGFSGERNRVVMVFDGSVKGLTVGAPVALRGVQIGQVTDIQLILDSDSVELIMLVEAELRGENIRRRGNRDSELIEELISRGLRAQLNTQSLLTGLLYIQLDFHPDSELILADIISPHPQIPTIPTELERITRKLESIDFAKVAGDLEATAEGLKAFVSNSEFQAMPGSIKTTLNSVTALSDQLKQQLALSLPKLDTVLDGAAGAVDTVNTELPQLAALLATNLKSLDSAIAAFEQTMRGVDGLVSHDSATTYQLNQTLQEIELAGRAVRQLAKTLEEQPESLIRGKSGDK